MYHESFGFAVGSSDDLVHTFFPRTRAGKTKDDLYQQWQHDVREANIVAGRITPDGRLRPGRQMLTSTELRRGVQHPESRDRLTVKRDEFRQRSERNPQPADDNRTKEQKNADYWADQAMIEAEEAMKPAARQAAKSKRIADEKAKQDAIDAKRTEIKASQSFIALREKIDNLLFLAKFDPTLQQGIVSELQHQSDMLDLFCDMSAINHNLRQIQQVVFGQRKDDALELRQAANIVEQQSQPWGDGLTWDKAPYPFHEGGVDYVRLVRRGKSVSIPADMVAGKTDEQLVAAHFPESQS